MGAAIQVEITDAAFSSADMLADFETQETGNEGAIASFFGRCRSENGTLSALELEHYPGMAESAIRAMSDEAARRWPVTRIQVRHRYGLVRPGETIVAVLSASAHRDAALQSVHFIMDYLKTNAPFWKREHLADGTIGSWVDAKATDDARRQSWDAQ